jgi:hypothetical protein
MRFKTFVQVNCLLLFFSWCSLASAQQITSAARSLTYGFVSPNTREGLKLEDAIRGLHSAEEGTLISRARSLGCVARSKVTTYKSIGSWIDGAEHGLMLRAHTDSSTMRYLISVLGRSAQQKATLYFHSDSAGESQMYILRPRNGNRSIRQLARTLDRAGVEFRTLVPTKASILIYVVDVKRELQTKISIVAKKLKARVTARRGSAEFIGDDSSREKGQVIFDEQIKSFESTNAPLIRKCRIK